MMSAEDTFEREFPILLEGIYQHYNHDFRKYAESSLRRRVSWAMRKLNMDSIEQLQNHIMRHPHNFTELLQYITVPVSSMFRDPEYFLALRNYVVPILKTYSSLKIWVAGCCAGEEAYSLAILLHEENLLSRTIVYATDINTAALERAERGIFGIDNLQAYTENYYRAGGNAVFSNYYYAAYGNVVFDRFLRKNIVFAEHSLSTDSAFSEVHLISCRNVLIYFQRELQDKTLKLFHDSLCRKGFLGLGSRESVDFSNCARLFSTCVKGARVYQKRDDSSLAFS